MLHNAFHIIEPECLCGDADGSGTVDIFDALLIAKYDAGLINPDEVACFECCDVNHDGKVDIFDALLIAKFDAGIISTLDCQKVNCQSAGNKAFLR